MQTPSRQPSFSQGEGRRRGIISLTPLIDVVFILLVFFMLSSSFLEWRAITVATTGSSTTGSGERSRESLLLSVSDVTIRLNGEQISIRELMPLLQRQMEADPTLFIQVMPIGETRLQSVVKLLDQFKLAGITRFRLIRDGNWSTPPAGVAGS